MSEFYDFVIIGNSAAGLQALRTLRRHDRQSSIAIIDRENRPAYSRVLTPYYIGGHIPIEGLNIVGHDFYADLGITPLFGHAAVALDPERHFVELDEGRRIGFGKLLLATGAEARTLALSAERSCVLRHLNDAERLVELFKKAKSITAIGAGLVSLPLLSHAHNEMEKHLVIGSDRMFSRVVDAEAAALIEEKLLNHGLQFHKQDDIERIEEADQMQMTLRSGKQITSDLLIVGKGVAPNIHLAASAGLDVTDGVSIDRLCRSKHPDIFAAGDAAEGADFITGEATIQGNWVTAVEQGENAALNMLGYDCVYQGSLKNNITEIFGIDVAAIGYCHDDVSETMTFWNRLTGRFRKIFLDEQHRVVGATMVGETNDSGYFYYLVSTRSRFPGRASMSGNCNYPKVQLYLGM